MSHIFKYIAMLLQSAGVADNAIKPLTTMIATLGAVIVVTSFYYILLRPLSGFVNKYVRKSETKIDDLLLPPPVVKAVSFVATTFLISYIFPKLTYYYDKATNGVSIACSILNIIAVAYLLILESKAFCELLRQKNAQRGGVLILRNILETVISVVAALLIISTVLDRDIAYVVSALGAMAAVLMLVFKDSILGMIAGIRLSVNGMLKEKDWVQVPKYNADGRVEDVSLTAVKVRNWDKSISTIPPYALMSEGFINKQRMLDLGVRQINRTFLIDVNSVRTLPPDQVERFSGEEWCKDIDLSNGAINLTLFRRWLRHCMLSHPRRSQSNEEMPMQVFVRELPATPTGLPLEIFFFVDCPDWEEFEELQADFIDEITASFHNFRLRLYQTLAYISE